MIKKNARPELASMYKVRPIDALGGADVAKARAEVEPPAPVRRGKRGPLPKGLEGVMFRMEPWQAAALRRIANERAGEELKRGAARIVRADYSEIVRAAVASWLAEHDTAAPGRRLAASWLEASGESRQAMRVQGVAVVSDAQPVALTADPPPEPPRVAVGSDASGKAEANAEEAERDRRTGLKKGTRWWHCTRCGSSVPAPRVNPGPCTCGGGLVPSIRPKRGEGRRYARHAPR